MRYIGATAEQAARAILAAFESPECLPAPLATLFVPPGAGVPSLNWSWRNRLLAALAGHTDARGFRQWQEAGRWVRAGEKSFPILAPVVRRVRDEGTGTLQEVVAGFKAVPVFGLSQTEGRPVAGGAADDGWLNDLPLVEVAQAWGLKVETYPGVPTGPYGLYQRGRRIALGVTNPATWCHELVHAADDRLGQLVEKGQRWTSETVAQLGSAVLLKLLGQDRQADVGFCRQYIAGYSAAAGLDPVAACFRVLDRTCRAVQLILDTARQPDPSAV